ncbi:MAG: DUF1329 domain-containing protein [Pelagibacterales bacterium]|nr:DUF1329 domain-containing protein [Pelagibacterales bacterium]
MKTIIKSLLSTFALVFIFIPNVNADGHSYTIDASNVSQYADMLSEGEKKMFEAYPDYKINVSSAVACSIPSDVSARSTSNGTMINNNEGFEVENSGQIPFPNPTDPQHYIWNARMNAGTQSNIMRFQTISNVDSSGNITVGEQETNIIFPAHERNVGKYEDGLFALFMQKNNSPARVKGVTVLVHDYIDSYENPRRAWSYSPATRRVRRAPDITYDTLVNASPLIVVDQYGTFNGAQDKYNWELKGVKKMVVAGVNNALGNNPLEVTHGVGHLNPEYVSYEEKEVAVVHATLKDGQRHLYASRTFYVTTDAFFIVSQDIYDGKGNLMRHALNTLTTEVAGLDGGCTVNAEATFDFATRQYAVNNMLGSAINSQPALYNGPSKDVSFYTPDGLRRYAR